MDKRFEQAIRDHVATLTQEQQDFQIMYECLGKKPRMDVLQLYVKMGLSFSYVSKTQDGILHVLAKKKKPEIMKMFIDLGADIHARNKDQETPLHIASTIGDIATMQLLIDAGADLNAHDIKGRTPIIRACVLARGVKATALLLKHDADMLSTGMDRKRLGGHCIVERNLYQLITKDLIEKGFFSYPDEQGLLPIHLAVFLGHEECVKEFGKLGIDLNIQNMMNGDTPLHYAVRCGKTDILHYLYEHEADDSIPNMEHETARELAERMQWPQVIQALSSAMEEAEMRRLEKALSNEKRESIMRKKDMHDTGNESGIKKSGMKKSKSKPESKQNDLALLARIILMMHDDEVHMPALRKEMRELQDYDIADGNGMTLMHHAAKLGSSRLIMYLITKNANPQVKDAINRTPLMYAILSGEPSTIDILMKMGYDVKDTDVMNNSLFILAYWMEMYDLASRFVREGADDRGFLKGHSID